MRHNRLKFFFAARFLETVNPHIPGDPYGWLTSGLQSRPERILDLCGGTGYAARVVASALPSAEVISLDLSPELIRAGHRYAASSGLSQIEFVRGDVANLPFEDNRFDLVLSTFSLHELSRCTRTQGLREVARVLRLDGQALFVDLDLPRHAKWLFQIYLYLSHGRDARQVLGTGLKDAITAAGLKVTRHQRSLGTVMRYQVIIATKSTDCRQS